KWSEEMIDGVSAVVRHHEDEWLLRVVEIDGHAMIAPRLCEDVSKDVDRIAGIGGSIEIVRRNREEAADLLIADCLRRDDQLPDPIRETRRIDCRRLFDRHVINKRIRR